MPRRAQPRSKVAQGTVAIGGEQTGIYPQESPGGWHCIGKTPVSLFNTTQKQPVFAKVGDVIQFKSIDGATYQEMCILPNSQLIKKERLV